MLQLFPPILPRDKELVTTSTWSRRGSLERNIAYIFYEIYNKIRELSAVAILACTMVFAYSHYPKKLENVVRSTLQKTYFAKTKNNTPFPNWFNA